MPPSPITPTPPDTARPRWGRDGTSSLPPGRPAPARDGGERPYPAVPVVPPSVAGRAIGGSRVHGPTALPWAGRVPIALLHRVTRILDSLCRVSGERARRHDRAIALWPVPRLSIGESRHNHHYADRTGVRHGVERGRLDLSAAVIRLLDRLGGRTRCARRRRAGSPRITPDGNHAFPTAS